MADASREPSLVEEHPDELGLERQVFVEDLHRDEPLEASDADDTSKMHRRHPARGDALKKLVPADLHSIERRPSRAPNGQELPKATLTHRVRTAFAISKRRPLCDNASMGRHVARAKLKAPHSKKRAWLRGSFVFVTACAGCHDWDSLDPRLGSSTDSASSSESATNASTSDDATTTVATVGGGGMGGAVTVSTSGGGMGGNDGGGGATVSVDSSSSSGGTQTLTVYATLATCAGASYTPAQCEAAADGGTGDGKELRIYKNATSNLIGYLIFDLGSSVDFSTVAVSNVTLTLTVADATAGNASTQSMSGDLQTATAFTEAELTQGMLPATKLSVAATFAVPTLKNTPVPIDVCTSQTECAFELGLSSGTVDHLYFKLAAANGHYSTDYYRDDAALRPVLVITYE
jgi:hypothetical protein